uniref:ATPase subunit 8 n=1 Tax=Dinomachus sikhimensis TaxID=2813434 RepID=A0A8T9ZX83_9HEMI|nr:ATPase subunit 8 [Dinomachus sikhimensis]
MPQMAPLWWETLYIMFIMMLMLTNIIIYYWTNKMPSPTTMDKKMSSVSNWKW